MDGITVLSILLFIVSIALSTIWLIVESGFNSKQIAALARELEEIKKTLNKSIDNRN